MFGLEAVDIHRVYLSIGRPEEQADGEGVRVEVVVHPVRYELHIEFIPYVF